MEKIVMYEKSKDALISLVASDAPRLLFHYPVLHRGGAEKSLLRLMSALADRGCEVHLVLTSAGGALEPDVDPRIRVHHLRSIRTWEAVHGKRMLNWPLKLLKWGMARMQEAWRSRSFYALVFDGAFAGLTGLSPAFICNKVNARMRFVFVRNDPAVDRAGRWVSGIREFNQRIDSYICVSDYVRKAMAVPYPEISRKLVTVYNLLDTPSMLAAAEGGDPFGEARHGLRVLSVCRLQEAAKGLRRMVAVHRRLLDAGLDHTWHLLGDGPDRLMLEAAIEAEGVAGTFKLHGAVSNPFPYYKHADVCAVLSRYEGLCGVVNEARVLERPVIATRFSGIEEQIQSGVNGLIVEQDVSSICDGMSLLLQDAQLRQRLAMGGYPAQLLDDEAKIDALLELIGEPASGGGRMA